MRHEPIKPSKEQMEEYVTIQMSGVTNMCAINTICALSFEGLTRGHCLYIMEHYLELINEYQIECMALGKREMEVL